MTTALAQTVSFRLPVATSMPLPPSRSHCLERACAIMRAAGGKLNYAALWIDLDRFKAVNRSFGHQAGDQVIEAFARRIQQALPISAELFRVGADEFVVLLEKICRADCRLLANRLCRGIDQPLELGPLLLHPTASIGIAYGEASEHAENLLERADRAMHEAKERGGNCWLFSGEERLPGRLGTLLAREELAIESALHKALKSGGLRLAYQPIVRPDGRVEAVEALMRCCVDGQDIAPDKLIPVAEKTGLVHRLGEWSLQTAVEFAAHAERLGYDLRVAVNVSRAQLSAPGFAGAVSAAILCSGVGPEKIELELTESLFLDMTPAVTRNLEACREIGVQLAIDDFGTGYSCLANLKDLPARKLKLDRAFVKVLPEDQRAYSVVKMITALGRDLGLTVVAEGVETRAQWDCLCRAGIDAIQGWFTARPMAELDILGWLPEIPS